MSIWDDIDRALPMEDYITVLRTTPGVQDPETGIPAPATTVQVLATACDVQDDGLRMRRSRQGDESKDADAVVYLPSSADITAVQEEDEVMVEYAHVLQAGTVVEISRFEQRLLVKWK